MSIEVTCRECGREYSVKDSFAGRTLSCKECGADFRVPRRRPARSERAGDNDPPQRRRASSARPVRREHNDEAHADPNMLWAFVGMLVIAAGIGIWALTQIGSKQPVRNETDPASTASTNPAVPNTATQRGIGDTLPLADVPVPAKFPELPPPLRTLAGGVTVHRVSLNGNGPGQRMTMRVYLPPRPPGRPQPKSWGCVLVAPAGTNLLVGNNLDGDDYHDETLPYAQAGFAVIFYSLDGGVRDLETMTNAEFANGYRRFKGACAGLVNGRNALEYAIKQIHQVDPERIFCAGHSSAGTLSLLLAEHEPRIKGCIAYAPATDLVQDMGELTNNSMLQSLLPGVKDFVRQSSPSTHIAKLKVPTFLFHSRDDQVTPYTMSSTFGSQLRGRGTPVKLHSVNRGGHYDPMINQGIPAAIAWMRTLPGEASRESAANAVVQTNGAIRKTNVPKPKFPPGRPLVLVELNGYSGKVDPTIEARRALVRYRWVHLGYVWVDAEAKELLIGAQTAKVNPLEAKTKLEEYGFDIKRVSIYPKGR